VIRFTLDHAPTAELSRLPGVGSVDVRGNAVMLSCLDSDQAIRAVVATYPSARDLEISGAGLEEAFLQLTSDRAGDIDPATGALT
jgi:ABC-2 type transport system ATP-binding protein